MLRKRRGSRRKHRRTSSISRLSLRRIPLKIRKPECHRDVLNFKQRRRAGWEIKRRKSASEDSLKRKNSSKELRDEEMMLSERKKRGITSRPRTLRNGIASRSRWKEIRFKKRITDFLRNLAILTTKSLYLRWIWCKLNSINRFNRSRQKESINLRLSRMKLERRCKESAKESLQILIQRSKGRERKRVGRIKWSVLALSLWKKRLRENGHSKLKMKNESSKDSELKITGIESRNKNRLKKLWKNKLVIESLKTTSQKLKR